jgi:RNA polymerase sigma-70 factor (ECF subfamily)
VRVQPLRVAQLPATGPNPSSSYFGADDAARRPGVELAPDDVPTPAIGTPRAVHRAADRWRVPDRGDPIGGRGAGHTPERYGDRSGPPSEVERRTEVDLRVTPPRVTPGPRGAMTESGNDLERLVAAANDGDRSALNRVLAIIRPLVVRYCRARIGRQERSSVSADDVAQEVCLAVLTALPGYRDQGRPFLAFVYGIAAHKVVDAHRSVARNRSEPVSELPEELDPYDGPEQRAMNGALSVQMGQLLDTLPPKQREILVLRVVVGLSAEETAEAVESTPGAVRVAQHRALSKLRTAVSAISEEVS